MTAPSTDVHASRATAGTPAARPPQDFCLPAAYRQQASALTHDDTTLLDGSGRRVEYWNPERVRASGRFQHHVYQWGASLVRRHRLTSVLDVGCGPGTKLAALIAPVCADIAGIDQPSAIAVAKRHGVPGDFRAVDLDRCRGVAAARTYDLVICADVLEHLLDPDPALAFIARHCHARSLVLLSTTDRARLRGRACMASEKPEHVREWSAPEFLAYLRSRSWSVVQSRLLPSADEPVTQALVQELMWRIGLAGTSEHRCHTVLCRPAGPECSQ
jgi:2-polyprenyl-3-methyl-5-hydroxy-6-metoxy-1,4-benzoquinol methylase